MIHRTSQFRPKLPQEKSDSRFIETLDTGYTAISYEDLEAITNFNLYSVKHNYFG